MFIQDLNEYPSSHSPEPYGLPFSVTREGKRGTLHLPADSVLRAVGWLADEVPSLGNTQEECIDRLIGACEGEQIVHDSLLGRHACLICFYKGELCPGDGPLIEWHGRTLQLYGHGHYLVRKQNVIYMAPELLLHYILDHDYQPPEEFVEAVIAGSFLTEEDLDFVPNEEPEPLVGINVTTAGGDTFRVNVGGIVNYKNKKHFVGEIEPPNVQLAPLRVDENGNGRFDVNNPITVPIADLDVMVRQED